MPKFGWKMYARGDRFRFAFLSEAYTFPCFSEPFKPRFVLR